MEVFSIWVRKESKAELPKYFDIIEFLKFYHYEEHSIFWKKRNPQTINNPASKTNIVAEARSHSQRKAFI